MNRFFLSVVFALCMFSWVSAQVTFKPGVRAGLNISRFTKQHKEVFDYKSKADFYIGGFGAIKLSKYYTLQPEIDYSRQGSYVVNGYQNNEKEKLDVSYLSIAVVNKFTFKDKINLIFGPTVDYQLKASKNDYLSNNFDLTFFLGAGYNFTDAFGIEARIKQGVIPMLHEETNVVYSLGATYAFDIK